MSQNEKKTELIVAQPWEYTHEPSTTRKLLRKLNKRVGSILTLKVQSFLKKKHLSVKIRQISQLFVGSICRNENKN